MATNQGCPMTPHADLVARLLRELVTLVRGECPALLNEDSGGDARLSLAIDDALAALPPPADPRARGGRAMSADVLAALDERRQTAPEAMTPADMAAWLRLDADAHEQAKAMSGPYEGSHTGDEDAAHCRAIAQWIVDRHQADVTREFLLGALGPWYLKP